MTPIAQTQYQNMVERWEEIPRQSKDLRSSQKLRKLVAIYKIKQTSSFQKVCALKN